MIDTKGWTADYLQGVKSGVYVVAHDLMKTNLKQWAKDLAARSEDYQRGFDYGIELGLSEMKKIAYRKRTDQEVA